MSNIEKIKAEINRRIENYWSDGDVDSVVVSGELEELIDFIDSLPEETKVDVTDFCKPIDPSIAQCIADNFWEMLGEEEKPSDDLEEAVFKEWGTTKEEYLAKSMDKVHLEMEIATYLQDWDDDDEIGLHLSTDNGSIPIELEDIRDLARHFAEWQREQMMKKVKFGVVCKNGERDEEDVWIELNPGSLPDYKDTDPIDFIIVKDYDRPRD